MDDGSADNDIEAKAIWEIGWQQNKIIAANRILFAENIDAINAKLGFDNLQSLIFSHLLLKYFIFSVF